MLKPGQRSDFQICLSDPRGEKNEWYLQLEGGFDGSEIDFLSEDSQNIYIRAVGKRIGDFDEQRDWKGGRGGEYFNEDPDKFYDGIGWSLSSGHYTPSLLWQYATGYRTVDQYLPGTSKSVKWIALTGETRYVASDPLAATTAADKAKLWVRRVGTPGTLTLEIRAADTGDPNGTVRQTVTKTTADVTDYPSVFLTFDWTGTQNITAGDFLVVYGASTDNARDHWEVGVDAATTNSKNDLNGSGAWSTSTFSLYYRITDADVARQWRFFHNYTTFCAVDIKDTGGGASQLYTIDSGGTATEVGSTDLGTVTGAPVVFNANKVYFPQGESDPIRTWNGGTVFADDGTNYATYLAMGQDATDGPVMWRANTTQGTTSSVSRATSAGTLSFGTAIPIGQNNAPINGITFWSDNGLYVFKTDSVWRVVADKATRLSSGIDSTPSIVNGMFALPFQQFLYFPWLFSLARLYAGQIDDVGIGWDGPGFPTGREGVYAAGCTYAAFQFYAITAGPSGTSCVVAYDGVGAWHEIFRAPSAGEKIRAVAIQPIVGMPLTGPGAKLWIDCGGDLIYIILPFNRARPLDDSTQMYHHEGILYSSTIDMGAASKLPKLIKSLTATTANLNGAGRRIECEYQVDESCGKDGFSNWIPVQPFLLSPESTVQINANNITQFRYRLRLLTDTNTTPPDLKGIVPNGLARGATRTVWSLKVKGDQVYSAGKTSDPNKLLRYLMEAQESPGAVVMTSTNPLFHDYAVELSLQRIRPVTDTRSVFTLNLVSV